MILFVSTFDLICFLLDPKKGGDTFCFNKLKYIWSYLFFLNSGKLVRNCLRNNGVVATEKRAPIVSIIGINQIHHHILQSEQKLFNNIASNFLSSSSHRFGDILTKRTKTRMVNIYFSSIYMKQEHIFSISFFFFTGKLSKEEWHRVLNSSGVPTSRSG